MVVFWSRRWITLSQGCHNVVFLTSLLQPKTNVVATLCFRSRFLDLVLTLQQCGDSDVVFLTKIKMCSDIIIIFFFRRYAILPCNSIFLIHKIYSVCVNAKRLLKWWIFENLQLVAWTCCLCSSLIRNSSLLSGGKFGTVVV